MLQTLESACCFVKAFRVQQVTGSIFSVSGFATQQLREVTTLINPWCIDLLDSDAMEHFDTKSPGQGAMHRLQALPFFTGKSQQISGGLKTHSFHFLLSFCSGIDSLWDMSECPDGCPSPLAPVCVNRTCIAPSCADLSWACTQDSELGIRARQYW